MAALNMKKVGGGGSGEVAKVTFEDQKKINLFAQHNIEVTELRHKMNFLQKELDSLDDAESEMMMLEDDCEIIPFQIGQVHIFIH